MWVLFVLLDFEELSNLFDRPLALLNKFLLLL